MKENAKIVDLVTGRNPAPVAADGQGSAMHDFHPAVQELLRPQSTKALYSEDGVFLGTRETWVARKASPEFLPQLRAAAARVEEDLAPADKGQLLTRVLTLLSHYRQDQHAPQVETMLAQDWAEDLGEFPMWAVDEAARWWRRNKIFRPSVCEIRRLCQEAARSEMETRDRLRLLLEASDPDARGRRDVAERARRITGSCLKRIAS